MKAPATWSEHIRCYRWNTAVSSTMKVVNDSDNYCSCPIQKLYEIIEFIDMPQTISAPFVHLYSSHFSDLNYKVSVFSRICFYVAHWRVNNYLQELYSRSLCLQYLRSVKFGLGGIFGFGFKWLLRLALFSSDNVGILILVTTAETTFTADKKPRVFEDESPWSANSATCQLDTLSQS